ncbi:hypothetical protein CPB85DRAFT_1325224 [Mucidula mucida]|nr:hypothetical protein CPB85DRAFT_1368010 [Mucidula mucida]KAF8900599.1 hypothetical protein CPB85DRAFT_1325224 [Mucidula mucida]
MNSTPFVPRQGESSPFLAQRYSAGRSLISTDYSRTRTINLCASPRLYPALIVDICVDYIQLHTMCIHPIRRYHRERMALSSASMLERGDFGHVLDLGASLASGLFADESFPSQVPRSREASSGLTSRLLEDHMGVTLYLIGRPSGFRRTCFKLTEDRGRISVT